MKYTFLINILYCLLCCTSSLQAQEASMDVRYRDPQVMARPGYDLVTVLRERVHYPADTLKNREGYIYISTTIDRNGNFRDVQALNGLEMSADIRTAAVQAVRELPAFIPAQDKGTAVSSAVIIPLPYPFPGEQDYVKLQVQPANMSVKARAPYNYNQYIFNHMTFDQELLKPEEKMRIFVRFTIDREGSITAVKAAITENDRPHKKILAREAERVISQMPRWSPEIKEGNTVPSIFQVPLTFISDEE